MAPKTTVTDADVDAFIAAIRDDQRRQESERICRLMAEATGQPPRMWGSGNLVLYLMEGFEGYEELLARLGKHSTGKTCLYVKRLDDVDLDVLRELVGRSYAHTATT
jgi:hypothetical protein